MKQSYYKTSFEHILAETKRISLIIQFYLERSRQDQRQNNEFKGLLILEQEVRKMLDQKALYRGAE